MRGEYNAEPCGQPNRYERRLTHMNSPKMKFVASLFGVLAVLFVTGCSAALVPPPTPISQPTKSSGEGLETRLGVPMTLHVGQTARVTDSPDPFAIQLYGIAGDSRCPKSVTCVWAGEARVQIMFEENGILHPPILELSSSPAGNQNVIALEGCIVTLIDVQPERETTEPIPSNAYAVTFVITRAAPTGTP